MTRGVFVTATDTGVGKTEVACALLSLMADAGLSPAAFKPYESGCDDLAAPADATALKAAARTDDDLALICPHRFRLPLAPGVAARRLRQDPPFAVTLELFRAFDRRALVVEGAGGLLVQSGHHRLERRHALATRGKGGADGCRHDGLADLGVRARYEEPAHAASAAKPLRPCRRRPGR